MDIGLFAGIVVARRKRICMVIFHTGFSVAVGSSMAYIDGYKQAKCRNYILCIAHIHIGSIGCADAKIHRPWHIFRSGN